MGYTFSRFVPSETSYSWRWYGFATEG